MATVTPNWEGVGLVVPTLFFSSVLSPTGGAILVSAPAAGTLNIIGDIDFSYDGTDGSALVSLFFGSLGTPFFYFEPVSGTVAKEHWSGFIVQRSPLNLEYAMSATTATFGCNVHGFTINDPAHG